MSLWSRKQDAAAAREAAQVGERIRELESILGLPFSGSSERRRLQNLRCLSASRIDPSDNGEQREPILWGDPRYFRS